MRRSLLKMVLLMLGFSLLDGNVMSITAMLSNSMAPSLIAYTDSQDVVLVDHVTLRTRDPRRGDVIRMRFSAPGQPLNHFFKRVAAGPGETLEIRDGGVVINGEPLRQPDVFTKIAYYNAGHASAGVVLRIASDSFFVLGDNNFDSFDSRFYGAVPRHDIVGLATMIVWPPERFGRIVPLGTVED